MPSIHLAIVGRVQGVGFRWFVCDQARMHGVAGWVRNREDGVVEVAARGESGALEVFRAAVQAGPDGAHVSAVRDLPPLPDAELPAGFSIRR